MPAIVDTGWQNPVQAFEEPGPGSVPWSNESNVLVTDGNDAEAVVGLAPTESELLVAEFDLTNSVPVDATITGLQVRFYGRSDGLAKINSIQLWDGQGAVASLIGTPKTAELPLGIWPSYSALNAGGESDLWDWTPDVDVVRNGSFGYSIQALGGATGNADALIDLMQFRVHFEAGATTRRFCRPCRRTPRMAFCEVE